jgi:murein DD-endopeptidase MepM/ murein hydrolase activator NlpD
MRPIRDVGEGAQALESMLLRQLIQDSGAFRGTSQAGGKIYGEMFCEALANAVAQSGGVGIAKLVEGSFEKLGGAEGAGAGEAGLAEQFITGRAADPGVPGASATNVTPELSSGYGRRRDPIDGTSRFHAGIDVAAPEGSPILAAAPGIVRSAGRRGGYGNAIEIDSGRGISTLYGHARAVAVKAGDQVEAGQPIGFVGHTGRATGSHLHFEVRENGKPKDPNPALIKWQQRADALIGRKP